MINYGFTHFGKGTLVKLIVKVNLQDVVNLIQKFSSLTLEEYVDKKGIDTIKIEGYISAEEIESFIMEKDLMIAKRDLEKATIRYETLVCWKNN
jgi:hypothetical protein